MNRRRIFEGRGATEKRGMHPIAGVLLVLYVLIALFYLFSSSGGGRVALPGPLLIYFLLKGKKQKASNIAVYVDKTEEGDFYFAYKTFEGGPQNDILVEECTYWYHPETKRDRPPYHLVVKIRSGEQTFYLKEKKNFLPNTAWERDDFRAMEGDNTFNVEGLERMAMAMERSDSGESFVY